MQITVPKSGYAQAALILLLVNAFGALVVGVPLLLAGLPPADRWLPVVAVAWGVASVGGAYAVWRLKPWAPIAVVPVQGVVALALLWAWAGWARDWSVLLVAAIAGGAAAFVLIDAARRRSR